MNRRGVSRPDDKRQPVQMICTRRTHRLTPSLIDHVGTIRDGSTVCHDMPWLTAEGRTCDDIRDVLGLPRDPSGDNKRTTRTGTYQWTTLYCAEIALVRCLSLLNLLRFPPFSTLSSASKINLIFFSATESFWSLSNRFKYLRVGFYCFDFSIVVASFSHPILLLSLEVHFLTLGEIFGAFLLENRIFFGENRD